jgi:CDP-diacylglycerol pyrophosphatase
MRSLTKRIGIALAIVLPVVLVLAALLAGPSWSTDHDALWKIVHDRCVPDQSGHGDPAPCASVDLPQRFAVLKDINGQTQFLLIPTDRVSGIEDASIVSEQAPNYWEAAWEARRYVNQRAGKTLPDDQIALAINSQFARSQNQLHIHIDCIRADVRDTLRALQPQIGANWMSARLLSQDYDVRLLSADDLKSKNLFSLVAEHLQPGQTMAAETIVLAGAVLPDGSSGLDLLVSRGGIGGNNGNGETLQDHACAVAKAVP